MSQLMTNLYSSSFFIVAAVLCISTLFYEVVEGRTKKAHNRVYMLLLAITLLEALTSIGTVFLEPYISVPGTPRSASDACRYVYFLTHTLMPPLFYIYVTMVSGVIRARRPERIVLELAPFIVAEIMVAINPVFHFVYTFDERHVFARGWGEALIYAISGVYLLISMAHLLKYWRMLTFRRRWGLLYCFALAILGIVLQMVIMKLRVELLFESMAFAGIMFTVEKEEDRIDGSTGVYNRTALKTDIENYLRLGTKLHLICVRVTNSEMLQRVTGAFDSDGMLRDVAIYLKSIHNAYDIYRAQSSAFLLVCRDFDSAQIRNLAFDITRRFDRPWSGHGTDLRLKAVVLLASLPDEYRTLEDTLLLCDGTLPHTESRRILSGEELGFLKRDMQVEEALVKGFSEHNFEIVYQPVYDLHSKSIYGAEAQLELHDARLGVILPPEYMPIAVKNDIVARINALLIEEIFMFLSSGIPTEMGLQRIHVGLSVYQCIDPSFLDMLRRCIHKYNVDASLINFELRRFEAAEDLPGLQKVLIAARELGFRLSLDRFGMEDSNLQTLSLFPFDMVIMDMEMMHTRRGTGLDEISYRIIENSVRMISQMHKQILIRGIITQDQLTRLSGMDIDYLQGEYYSKAVSPNELISILRVTEIARREEQQARAQSEAKSSFLANMSHEIRTPINAILGMNEMILREAKDDQIRIYARDIERAGNSLLSLINDILDFSKIEAGSMEIVLVEYGLSSVINDVTNLMRGKMAQKHLEFKIDVDETLPETLYGDEMRIRQIMINLLNNAVKYTQTGSVTLAVHGQYIDDDSIQLMIDIIDTGIGIREEDVGKLFGTFQRVDMDKNRTVEGTGLGLAITRNLLTLMSGDIKVSSVYGKGSTFSVQIPQMVLDSKPIGDLRDRYLAHIESQEEYRESFTAPDARILVVDDTQMNLTVVKGLLKQTQLKIDTALSGRECLELVKRTDYDCIFLDYRMPEMDGVMTLQKMREQQNGRNDRTPVIVLTANALTGAREKFISEGFNDYLTKPVESAKLEEMLIRYLPADKVQTTKVSLEKPTDQKEKAELPDDPRIRELQEALPTLEIHTGINRCGGLDGYLQAVEIYYKSIASKADEIENCMKNGDLENYTIQVHALKSTSRVIGAMELGEKAWELEQAGDQQDEDTIRDKTPALLADLRGIGVALGGIYRKEESAKDLPPIDPVTLAEAWRTMLDFVAQMDYEDSAFVLEELNSYSLEGDDRFRADAIADALERLDWVSIEDMLKEALGGEAQG